MVSKRNVSVQLIRMIAMFMICYLTTPVLQWIKEKPLGRNVGIIVLIAAVTVNVLDKWGAITYILSTLMLSWMAAVVLHWIIGRIKCIKY